MKYEIINYTCNLISVMQVSILCLIQASQASPVEPCTPERRCGASALAEHVWSTDHQVNLSKAKVINSHPFATTRCLLESWHIQRHHNTLNGRKGLCLESTNINVGNMNVLINE